MKKLLSLEHSLELVAGLIAVGALLGVLQTFIVGKHYVIPTMILFLAVIFGNLAHYGLQGRHWAKLLLFWVFFLLTCHAFMALFFAATPREILGGAFLPVYGVVFLGLALLCWQYASRNRLFGAS